MSGGQGRRERYRGARRQGLAKNTRARLRGGGAIRRQKTKRNQCVQTQRSRRRSPKREESVRPLSGKKKGNSQTVKAEMRNAIAEMRVKLRMEGVSLGGGGVGESDGRTWFERRIKRNRALRASPQEKQKDAEKKRAKNSSAKKGDEESQVRCFQVKANRKGAKTRLTQKQAGLWKKRERGRKAKTAIVDVKKKKSLKVKKKGWKKEVKRLENAQKNSRGEAHATRIRKQKKRPPHFSVRGNWKSPYKEEKRLRGGKKKKREKKRTILFCRGQENR